MASIGCFRLDTANQRLFCGATEIHLTRKASAILDVLANRPNEVVTHNELLDVVWTGIHVQPEVLKVYIAEIRRALQDSATNPRYIQTVHRRGYRLISAGSTSRSSRNKPLRSELLVGRTQEMAILSKRLRVAASGSLQMIFISGKAGMGKSTLLQAFLHRVGGRVGTRSAVGRVAHARGQMEPFSPVLGAVGDLLAGPDPEPLLRVFQQCAPQWLTELPSSLRSEELRQISTSCTGSSSQRMIRELAEALDECCRASLVVIGLDDLHHADPSSVDLLEYLAVRQRPGNLLIVGTADIDSGSDRLLACINTLHARALCELIRLDPLSRTNVRRFLDLRYSQCDGNDALAEQLQKISGGVPLYMTSALGYMESQGWVLKTAKGWISSTKTVRLEELLPPALNGLVELKIRQLPAEEQQVLEAAAILGPEFPSFLVACSLGQPLATVEDILTQMARTREWLEPAGFTPVQSDSTSARFRFVHRVVYEVLYSRQSPAERVRRHRRVAAALESTQANRSGSSAFDLALHFVAGQECSKGLPYLRAAAAVALRRCAGPEATAILAEALQIARSLPSTSRNRAELEVLNELGAACFACGDFNGCARAWHEVASKSLKLGLIDVAIRATSRLAFPVGWNNPALLCSAADHILANLHRMESPVAKAEIIIRALGLRDIGGAWNPEDTANAAAALDEIERHGDPVQLASARIQCAWFQLRESQYRAANRAFEESLPLVLEHDPIDVLRAEWGLGWGLLQVAEWGRMQSGLGAASAHSRRNGNDRVEALFEMQLAWLHFECGAYESAMTIARRAMELSSRPARGVGIVMCHVIMAIASVGMGDSEGALNFAQQALAAITPSETFWRAVAVNSSVHAHLLKGNEREAQNSAHQLLQISAEMREHTWRAIALSTCAKAFATIGQKRLARRCSDTALQLVAIGDLPLAKWRVEAMVADTYERFGGGGSEKMARLRARSRQSREQLFSSLAIHDPLRRYATLGS